MNHDEATQEEHPNIPRQQQTQVPSAEHKDEEGKPNAATVETLTTLRMTSHQRRQRRRSQLRYRDKQSMLQLNLVLDINELRAQIAHFDRVRSLLQTQQLNAKSQWIQSLVQRVRQFCHLFGRGFKNPSASDPPTSRAYFARQNDFAHWLMAEPFLRNDEPVDADHILALWRAAFASHATLHVEMVSCQALQFDQEDEFCVVKLVSRWHTRLCHDTLQRVFPHVLQDQLLVQTLVNQCFVYDAQVDYYFDTRGRLVRQTYEVDLLQDMVRLLGRVCDAVYVTQRAILPPAMLPGVASVVIPPAQTATERLSQETKEEEEEQQEGKEEHKSATTGYKHAVSFLLS